MTQVLINGIELGCAYALVALGFSLIYGTVRFFHFAHGGVYAFGAYAAYMLIKVCAIPPLAAIPIAIICSSAFGILLDLLVYRPIRARGASPLVLLIASLGALIAIQNAISLIFGDATLAVRTGTGTRSIALWGGANLTDAQTCVIIASVFIFIALSLFLRRTSVGLSIRGVSNDEELARIVGLKPQLARSWAFAIGSAVAGLAGIAVAYDVDLRPIMGFQAMLGAVVAVVVGGIGSIEGAFVGSLFVGLVQSLAAWPLPSEWQNTVLFAILVAFLLLRPQGFFGRKPVR